MRLRVEVASDDQIYLDLDGHRLDVARHVSDLVTERLAEVDRLEDL